MIGNILGGIVTAGVWLMVGAVAAVFMVTFWEGIQNWLNNRAADIVERYLGYKARERMHKAVATISKVVDKIKNKTVIYTKRNDLDMYMDKTTTVSSADIRTIDPRVIEELQSKSNNELVQEYSYQVRR